MSNFIDALEGFTLEDLLSKDGLMLQIGNDAPDDLEEEEFSYRSDVHLTNDEVLNLLNMEEFRDDEDDKREEESATITAFGLNFEKMKLKMTDITRNYKVLKYVKSKGTGELVPKDALVTIHYIGYFEYRDEPFDSTYARGGPDRLRLGEGRVIPGLELGISTMRKFETAMFLIHPDLAYGELGCAPRIPPNEEVMFIVQLVDFLDNGTADTLENLSVEEKKSFPKIKKSISDILNTGKDYFKRKRYSQAIREYHKAILWLEKVRLQDDEEEEDFNHLLSKCYMNLAVCYNATDKPRKVCAACNSMPIKSSKCYFHHGRALSKMGAYKEAMEKLQIANRILPQNAPILKEIQEVNEKQKKWNEVDRRMCSRMFRNTHEDKQLTEFQRYARNMCQTLVNDTQVLRHVVPEGLTPEEDKCIREEAAAVGLLITKHTRYGKEVLYIHKPNY